MDFNLHMHLLALNCVAIILLATVYKHTVMKTSLASKAIVYRIILPFLAMNLVWFWNLDVAFPVNETMYFIGQNNTTSEYNL